MPLVGAGTLVDEVAVARTDHSLERDVRSALDTGQFKLHWQPIVSCTTGELRGFEALVRWDRPGYGRTPPSVFVPVIERLGLFKKLDEWVLGHACRAAAQWPSHLRAAINVSACWFDSTGLTAAVANALEESEIEPERLELEVSEAVFIASKANAAAELTRIKTLGVRLSLDDFGTGYASLGYLQEMPFDKIKLDQSFVRRLGTCRRTEAIVQAVLKLGGGLGMTVCAEGVERPEQLKVLQTYRCDEVQGYLIGYPERALPNMLDFYDRLDESLDFIAPATWQSALNLPTL
jgi:EAL domain-containing protein (putative c-di-GMP-specific phosphodiesterase class I)